MKTTKHYFEQRSEKWELARIGRIGGSEAIGVTTPARLKTIVYKKLAEVLTNKQEEVYETAAMSRGIELEPLAIAQYEQDTFQDVTHIGYITNEDYKYAGLSVDGIIGDTGAVEVKCQGAKAYVESVITNKPPTVYLPQLAWYFLILNELQWIDYVIFNPDVKSKPYYKIRLTREELQDSIDKVREGYFKFEAKIDEYIKLF
ncbi:MAG: YqaJ viral recombinase family protein [Bacteroidetes bacterium]|nr:YqaJ viral recombinase family protein [Bacteroidota bacterium]